jgi:hypothetical protein
LLNHLQAILVHVRIAATFLPLGTAQRKFRAGKRHQRLFMRGVLMLALVRIAFDSGAALAVAKMEKKMFRELKISKLAAVTLLASLLPCVAVHAASLSSVQGKVQLSRAGGAFQPVTGPTIINPGDVIRAEMGSSAQVVYANGSIASVSGGSTLTVAADRSSVLSDRASAGGPEAPKDVPVEPHGHELGGQGLSTTTLIVGGAVAAGGGLLLYKTLHDQKKNKSASP